MASSREDHFVYIVLPYLGMKPMERIPGSPLKWPRKYSHGIPAAIHLSFSIPFPTRGVSFLSFFFSLLRNTCHDGMSLHRTLQALLRENSLR